MTDRTVCKIHHGPNGGRFYVTRKKGGGTRRVYLKPGEKPPSK